MFAISSLLSCAVVVLLQSVLSNRALSWLSELAVPRRPIPVRFDMHTVNRLARSACVQDRRLVHSSTNVYVVKPLANGGNELAYISNIFNMVSSHGPRNRKSA